MDQKKLSMIDVARLSGVSVATVSRVLNRNGRYSEETEKRVLDIVRQYDYKLNMNAKSLRTNKSQSIGVIVPDITNEFFAKIVRSIENYMVPHHYSVFVCDSNEDEEMENMHIENLISKSVDGIIYISGKSEVRTLSEEYHIPVVYIDRSPGNASLMVQSDNVLGGFLATEELIRGGCSRIMMLRDYRWLSPVRQRYAGYKKAQEKYGIPVYEELQVNVNVDYASAKKKMCEVLDSGLKFDGIFASNDIIALGALHALLEHGIKVPGRIKLVGFDDISLSEFCDPPITTVTQNTDRMGKRSAQTLLKLMKDENIGSSNQIIIPVSLHKRGTT
jgi:Transcriptional regulators